MKQRKGANDRLNHHVLTMFVLTLMLAGCAAPGAPPASSLPESPPARGLRALEMVVNTEVLNLATKPAGAVNPARTTRIFNAGLTNIDPAGDPHPYLAESVPQVNTDTWRVFPDGRMETIWTLRPGLTWHDGQPLTAEDFAFAFRMYVAPELRGVFTSKPQEIIERLEVVDPRTIKIYWRSPFLHTGEGLDPLPRAHLIEPFAAFEQDPIGQRDTLMSARFWTVEYVGAGPYKLTNWEPASHLEGEAFEGHALGRPKIDRLVVRFINNENTVLANMLAGRAHLVMAHTIGPEQASTLRREAGLVVLADPGAVVVADPQHRPDYQRTPALHDPRVRKALAHATDKEAINDGLYDGQGVIPHTLLSPLVTYYAEVDRVITKYPYDLRKTEQLMSESGYSRDRGGFYVDSSGQRLQPPLWAPPRAQQEQFLSLVTKMWQEAGFDPQPLAMSAALSRDQETNATFPGILLAGVGGIGREGGAKSLTREEIATPANRWSGQNRGGWSNPDYDLVWQRYNTTLREPEQIQAMVEMMKLHTELLPKFPLYYFLGFVVHVGALKGPEGDSNHWNIHQWELRN